MNESLESTSSSLLKETIRYYEGRGRDLGILRCELWLSTREAGPEEDEQVYCWPQTDNTASVPRKTLEKKVVTHIGPNQSVLHLVQDLNRSHHSLERTPRDQQHRFDDKPPSQWIASIPIDIYTATSLNGEYRRHLPRFRGMVCWLGDFTTQSTALTWANGGDGSRDLDIFLDIATSQIAQTYAHELCFANISVLERQNPSSQSSATSVESIPTDTPEFYEYDKKDDLEFQSKGKAKNTRISLLDEYDDSNDTKPAAAAPDCKTRTLSTLQAYFRKYKGGGQKGPMPLCWRQVLFTFVGSFFTIFFIHISNQLIKINYVNGQPSGASQLNMNTATTVEVLRAVYDDYLSTEEWEAFEMGPFGATCVLVFAMTSAHASQPVNMLFGASIGMVVGKLVGYLDLVNVGLGVRMSLAVALTASIMAATGLLYPPGAALAIIFTSRLLGWERFMLQAIGTVLTFSLGIMINNLHPMRIYPIFWLGFKPRELCKKPSLNRNGDSDGRGSACRSIL